jgi:pyrroline-5-carboxylate reductase
MTSILKDSKIAFIGGGNMASAIIAGLAARGIAKTNIVVSEPWEVNRAKLDAQSIPTTTDNADAARDARVVILAVKPQVTRPVCEELAAAWADRRELPVVVSVAAGVTLDSIVSWSRTADGRTAHVVRVMPNTPALVGEGASGLFAGADVTEQEKELVTALMASVSKATEWVSKEELLNVVTGLSGSGPAYFFNMVEHLIKSAVALGLPEDQAARLAKQTCFGAGKMMIESSESPGQLRQNVTSPNGTTHAALETFKSLGFEKIVDDSVKAATDRSIELSKL